VFDFLTRSRGLRRIRNINTFIILLAFTLKWVLLGNKAKKPKTAHLE